MYSNSTENYQLPQYAGTDRAEWLDNNAAFATIDKTMRENAVNATSALSQAQSASTTASAAQTTATNAASAAQTAQNGVNQNAANISGLNTRVSAVETSTGNLTAQMNGKTISVLTQTAYDGLTVKDANTIYFVTADGE